MDLYRLLLLVLTPLLVESAAEASVTDWQWQFGGGHYLYVGTSLSASDGADALDVQMAGGQYWYVATYHQNGVDAWTGATGFYSTDLRGPLALTPGQSKTWRFFLWGDPSRSSAAQPLGFQWGWNSSAAPAFGEIHYTLTYVGCAQGVTGVSLPLGTVMDLNRHTQGTWDFPGYVTTDGRTGYVFDLTTTVIPEPSSLPALASGLAGLAGFALRRRRAR